MKNTKWWGSYQRGLYTNLFFLKPCSEWSKLLLSLKICKIRRVVAIGYNRLDRESKSLLWFRSGIYLTCICSLFYSSSLEILNNYIVDKASAVYKFIVETNRMDEKVDLEGCGHYSPPTNSSI